ncbi:hypothetical protein L914_07194 [Phytophthora nicotianae]|uniref:CCHC-type domain-containing protein n=1 Tax=Phytophthora nicotianae TaxID=4792 RepID=W2NJW0_PHYNI|nr:hypothetical protein L914_07194 [Phytophthora nicotianae]
MALPSGDIVPHQRPQLGGRQRHATFNHRYSDGGICVAVVPFLGFQNASEGADVGAIHPRCTRALRSLQLSAVLRHKLRQLRQDSDIEEYNGKYSSLIFRVEDMSEVDQVSYYCDGLNRATQAYVKLHNPTTLSEAMDQAVKHEMSHFSGGRKTAMDNRRSFKPGHYAPAEQMKEGPVCYHCKKPGHFKRDCEKLKMDLENEQPRQ